jgi:glycosyltransferase involved in cell wall biosynthesis
VEALTERRLVGHVVRSYLPRSETFTYTQIRSLTRYRSRVFALRRENADEFPGVEVVSLPAPAGVVGRACRLAIARARGARTPFEYRLAGAASDCAVLHAHFGWMGIASVYAQRRLGIPLVTTFHANDIAADRADLARGYPALFATGTLFTAVGPGMAQRLAARGCPGDRIRVVKLGIDASRIQLAPETRAGPLVVLQVARLTEKKGIAVTLQAFARLQRELPGSECWIVGEGIERARLEALAASLQIAGRVRFLGALSHEATLALMADATVGVQASVTAGDGDIEGTPTVLLEMQAAGLPIVASAHADIPTIVADPSRLVPEGSVDALADALLAVARLSGDERRRRGLEGRAFVEREHGLAATARQIEAVYDESIELARSEPSRRA